MATASKWLQWQPESGLETSRDRTDKADKTDKTLPSVSSVSFVSSPLYTQNPMEWEPEFERWAAEKCFFRDGAWQSISSLHVDFSEWCVANKSVPCRRDVFETLLAIQGFSAHDGMIAGLVLAQDYQILLACRREA